METLNFTSLKQKINLWIKELNFQAVGISHCDLSEAEEHLKEWLAKGFHADMDYMHKHGLKRTRPALLVPGTISVISVRMAYYPPTEEIRQRLNDANQAIIANYALGKDYHYILKDKLKQLAEKIQQTIGPFGYRAFTDSAPVMERAIAQEAGLGWIGKNTCLISKHEGSYFLLGEVYTDLPLPSDEKATAHCGSCSACIDACPTKAIVAPYQLDARKCISYWTIEHKGSIPEWIREAMGNKIFGCDDCQVVCPWNKYAAMPKEHTFFPQNNLDKVSLLDCFAWDKATFKKITQGSPISRPGYAGFMRNVAIALGNAPYSEKIINTLKEKANDPNPIIQEHVQWALDKQLMHPLASRST
jgi:epoxyqueuosine reductase